MTNCSIYKNNNITELRCQYLPQQWWRFTAMAKIIKTGNIITMREALHTPLNYIRKMDKQHYIYLPTGEMRTYKTQSRVSSGSLRRTFVRLRDLIRCNFDGGNDQLFITLTYAENMTDTARLSRDYDRFYKRLRRYINRPLKYIAVIEPQERGAWHIHLMLRTVDKTPLYIADNVIRKLWKNGITQTERLKNADDLGAYYVTYFTDLYGSDHKRKKAARLPLYPPHFKFYRCSQNLEKPTIVELPHSEAAAIIGKPQTETIVIIKGADNHGNPILLNAYRYSVANAHRKKEYNESCCETCNKMSFCCETCNKMSKIVKVIDVTTKSYETLGVIKNVNNNCNNC